LPAWHIDGLVQSFRLNCWSIGRRHPVNILRKSAAHREFMRLTPYHGMGYVIPTCRRSIPTASRSSRVKRDGHGLLCPSILPASFALSWSLPQFNLAVRRTVMIRRPSLSHGLYLPTAHSANGVH
jgi:hypothetical protein